MKTPILFAILLALWAAPVAAGTPGSIDCRADIKRALADIFQHGPFEMTRRDAAMGGSESIAQIIPGKAMHSSTTIAGHSAEMTIVGGRLWRRADDGPWTEYPMENDYLLQLDKPAFFDAADDMVRPRCIGHVELDGSTYIAFGFGADVPDVTVDVTFYVDASTGLLGRVDGTTVVGSESSTSTVHYRYDPTITIEPPM